MKIRIRTASSKELEGKYPTPTTGTTAYVGMFMLVEGTSKMLAAWIHENIEAAGYAFAGEPFPHSGERIGEIQAQLERAAKNDELVVFGNTAAPDIFTVEEI